MLFIYGLNNFQSYGYGKGEDDLITLLKCTLNDGPVAVVRLAKRLKASDLRSSSDCTENSGPPKGGLGSSHTPDRTNQFIATKRDRAKARMSCLTCLHH